MITPFKNDYAFGLNVHTVNGHKVIDHNGGIEGFSTMLAYYPDDKLTLVALANMAPASSGEIVSQLALLAQGGTVTLQSERKEIPLDPKVLARYVGAYRMSAGGDMLITLDGSQLSGQLTGQGALPIFPQSETRFFLKAVNAEIEFPTTPVDGHASQLTLHQNGRDVVGTRLDEAETKKLADAAATVAKRFKDQTAAPGSEAALRRIIEELRSGEPKYELMGAGIANLTRQQLPQLKATVTQLGTVQTVAFKGVGPAGADIYEVKFEHGSMEWRIGMDTDGKVAQVGLRPL